MPEGVTQFLEQFGASLAATVSQLMSKPVQSRVVGTTEAGATEVWISASLADVAGAEVSLSYSQRVGLFLARAMLSESPGEATQLTDDDRELLAEFWKQAIGRTGTDLASLLRDRTLVVGSSQLPEWQPATAADYFLQIEGGEELRLKIHLSLEFVREVSPPQPDIVAAAPAASENGNNLDLLLDVPLSVTLRFGQRRMPLREVLQLSSGAVIELDRQAEDAVDLLLDERLLARGQVVVVDGCYGLRVTEVCR